MYKLLPKDIIIYIYQFDNTYKIMYNKCLDELKMLLNDYQKQFDFSIKIINNASLGDEAYYPELEECIQWIKKYGQVYNPSFYILNKIKN